MKKIGKVIYSRHARQCPPTPGSVPERKLPPAANEPSSAGHRSGCSSLCSVRCLHHCAISTVDPYPFADLILRPVVEHLGASKCARVGHHPHDRQLNSHHIAQRHSPPYRKPTWYMNTCPKCGIEKTQTREKWILNQFLSSTVTARRSVPATQWPSKGWQRTSDPARARSWAPPSIPQCLAPWAECPHLVAGGGHPRSDQSELAGLSLRRQRGKGWGWAIRQRELRRMLSAC